MKTKRIDKPLYSLDVDFESEHVDGLWAYGGVSLSEPQTASFLAGAMASQPTQADFSLAYEKYVMLASEQSGVNSASQMALLVSDHTPQEQQVVSETPAAQEAVAFDNGVSNISFREVLARYFDVYLPISTKGTAVQDYYSGKANGEAGFDIWIHFSGTGWTESLQKAFKNAADYFTTVITNDIGGDGIINGNRVDDLYISAELGSIDGKGGTLGYAGITDMWRGTEFTAAGAMKFDTADVSKFYNLGVWDDIVTHEIMHVLGFGSLWNYGSNPLVASAGKYTGAAALSAYNAATGRKNAYIPVETDGGSGTANSHWDEAALDKENMTGYTENSGNYMSKYSVMSLADLGYNVKYKDYQYDNVVIG